MVAAAQLGLRRRGARRQLTWWPRWAPSGGQARSARKQEQGQHPYGRLRVVLSGRELRASRDAWISREAIARPHGEHKPSAPTGGVSGRFTVRHDTDSRPRSRDARTRHHRDHPARVAGIPSTDRPTAEARRTGSAPDAAAAPVAARARGVVNAAVPRLGGAGALMTTEDAIRATTAAPSSSPSRDGRALRPERHY